MQFTPNIMERYAAALRNLIARRVIKGENTPKNLRLLKIILVFSSIWRSETKGKVNVFKNAQRLLNAAALKLDENEIDLIYDLKGEKAYEIDFGLLKLLILELVSTPTKTKVDIKMIFLKDRMIFTVQNAKASKILKSLVKKLKGVLIKTRGESNFAVRLSSPCVYDYEISTEDTEDFEDSFSTVNIMLYLQPFRHI